MSEATSSVGPSNVALAANERWKLDVVSSSSTNPDAVGGDAWCAGVAVRGRAGA
jgi:hypothetical protein